MIIYDNHNYDRDYDNNTDNENNNAKCISLK